MCQLARRTRFDDIKATERFRSGVPFFGLMEKCNLGQEVQHNSPPSVDELRVDCSRSNTLLLEQLKENEHSSELLELTRADAAVGRMSMPTPIENVDLGLMRLCPRFPVIQGEREDGRPKVRPVDHFSWSAPPVGAEKREGKKQMRCNSINGRTVMPEKMKYDHIDELTQVAKWIFNDLKVWVDYSFLSMIAHVFVQVVPGIWKADIKAAFRRMPICKEHRWAAAIAFKAENQVSGSMSGRT